MLLTGIAFFSFSSDQFIACCHRSSALTQRSSVHTQPATIDEETTTTSVLAMSGKSSILASSQRLALLDSIPEYRALQRELTRERQRCETWASDYRKLQSDFENYRASSFREYASHYLLFNRC